MSLRVKAGIDLDELKKYGFKTGKEWADAGERCLEGGLMLEPVMVDGICWML